MSDNRSNKLIPLLLIIAAVLLFGRPRIPSLLRTLLTVAAVIAILIVLVIIVVFVAALRKSKDPVVTAKNEEKNSLANARSTLMQLRNTASRVENDAVRALANDVAADADRILQTLKSQPEDLPRMRRFLSYYLPTTQGILAKYVRVEESGVDLDDMTGNVTACLSDIRTAMGRLYENLFDNDKLDLSVEMETLMLTAKRDGLIDDDALVMPPISRAAAAEDADDAAETKIELTL